MSAQTTEAVIPNGVGQQEAITSQGSGGVPNSTDRQHAGSYIDVVVQQTRGAVPDEAPSRELQTDELPGPSSSSGAATMAAQVKQQQKASTMPTMGGTQSLEPSGLAAERPETSVHVRTPRPSEQQRGISQPSWLSGMEVPRWFAKLGSILNTGSGSAQADLAPSPFPGVSPFSSPPGGPSFRLRSPMRPRAIPPAPTPPSSSSIPAEAIQAEVQRQLHGVLQQLQVFGERNEQLQMELQEARMQLQLEQQRSANQENTLVRPSGLLGDLGSATLDPGALAGLPPIAPFRESQHEAMHQNEQLYDEGPEIPPQPRHQGLPEAGSTADRAGLSGGWNYEHSRPDRAQEDRELPRTMSEGPGMLRSWWENRGRSATPPPTAAKAGSAKSPVLEALARGVQQLQELQMQALSKPATAAHEQVKPGTMTLTAMPDSSSATDSALSFQDWLEVSSSIMSDISESSATWWQGVLNAVEQTYKKWLAASPIEKLAIEPTATEQWCSGRWLRVNARGSSMLLGAMPSDLRADMVSRRCTQDCVRMLYRLYTHYQPGGSAERSEVLRRLQSPADTPGTETLEGVVKVLRAWPRWLERCRAVQMSPDPSVLSRGLQALTSRHIEGSPDANFRTSMLRATLRLDARPSLDQVVGYHKHLQAELELLLGAKSTASSTAPQAKLRAVDPQLPPKARDAGGGRQGPAQELCRYFAKATGCKRGDKCGFSHNMSGLDREARSKKCLRCGSEAHRQRDCPIGRTPAKGGTGVPKDGAPLKPTGGSSPTSTQSTMATLGTTTGSSVSTTDPVQGTPWTLEALVQAAQQMVQTQGGESPGGDGSPEKTRPTMKVLQLRDIRVCTMEATTSALLDSGATHSLRSATSEKEWDEAEPVGVQLAGNHQLVMRITKSGTLLMPWRSSLTGKHNHPHAQTIVPMGQLIKTSGYTMVWTPHECYLCNDTGERIPLQLSGGCPQMKELEALALIARLEDRKLDLLNNEVMATEEKVSMAAMAMEKHWTHYLYDYVTTGSFESGLRAVRDAPFFEDIPGECLSNLIPSAGLWSGWDILKQIGWLTRPQRRKVLTSKRWVVHLFAGKEGHWEFMKLDQGDTTVLELDLARSYGQDVMRNEVWRMLLWGAKEGKVDVVFGGPPGRSQQNLKGGLRDTKSLTLVARMMWLYVVAQVGREVNGGVVNKNRDVGFIMEYPEGLTPEEKIDRELRVLRAEDQSRVSAGRGGVASWDHTRQFWENVQRPTWEEWVGVCTVDASRSFWDTRMWKMFSREADLHEVSFDQGAMGSTARTRTTLGTNIYSLLSLNGVRVPDPEALPERCEGDHVWSPGLVNAVVVALSFWHTDSRCTPRLRAMTPVQWQKHVASNHADYRRDCATCVMARGSGRQHRRVHHPETYVLTADVAGPLTPGLDSTSKGTLGKNLKYLLVAKYLVPKAYVEAFSGRAPPLDDGIPKDKDEKEPKPEEKPGVVVPEEDEDLFGDMFDGGLDEKKIVQAAEVVAFPDDEDLLEARALDIEEEYYPSDPEHEEEDKAEVVEPDETQQQPGDITMQEGDCIPPECTYLTFATALPNNQSRTIRSGLQDIILYLQMHGLPVYRFHADKGEFYNHLFRAWLREQGVVGTWSEPSMPQSNGHAESTVKWVKGRARTLLQAAKLPVRLWPVAAATAATEQRARVLGWRSCLAAPFGATVHLRKKAFDKYGPLRREHGMDSKWTTGRYVGVSTIVHRGHVVYIPAEGEDKEKFLHTLHVRPNLVDPGRPEEELRVEPPKPRHRVVTKTGPELIEMRAATLMTEEAKLVANQLAEKVLVDWSWEEATQLIYDLAKVEFFNTRKFGVYRHGGAVGWLSGIVDYPAISKMLVRYVTDTIPEATFTSLLVSFNAPKGMHKDTNNDVHTKNYVIPVVCPAHGGELWIELRAGDVVRGRIEQRQVGKQLLYGQLEQLVTGSCIAFNPRRYHEVQDWEGTRVNIIAYTPDCLGKLSKQDLETLHDHGYPVPLTQLPEYHGNPQVEDELPPSMQTLQVTKQEEESESEAWAMYLDMSPGLVKIAKDEQSKPVYPQLNKAEVSYTLNIERVIAELSGPLDVTHAVKTEEVTANLEAWRPAIMKELQSIECTIVKLYPGSEERRMWFNKCGVQRLPMKFVFTIKPNSGAVLEDPSTWYKRKARLVICGNMATDEGNPLYTETAPAEVVRAALALSTKKSWSVAILDVVAAFIKTPLGRTPTDPVVVAQPPRLLELSGVVVKFELWGLIRALYGLREAPMLWGNYRDEVLRKMPLPRSLAWIQGQAITAWWTIRGPDGEVQAIVVVYVDDFMICGPRSLVEEIGKAIQHCWDTSELSVLGPQNSIRFLGMELQRMEETGTEIQVFQQGYISELLRAHGVKDTQLDKVPITKDLAILPESVEPAEPAVTREAQRVTGEALWVTQRTRPDLAYTTSMMAALAMKCPTQAVAIGSKVLGYLRRTIEYGMTIKWNGEGLVMYSDAAYAPQGGRSHGGWLVTYGGVPLVWRSSRQSMITLSTAEAELLALLDGAVAVKGIEAILNDAGEVVEQRKLASDSTSALSISAGGSSWRTRHLRIKAGWLQEQIADGYFEMSHCPGEMLPADLLTKPLSSARMEHLLRLWGVGMPHRPVSSTTTTRTSARMLVALICCLLIVSVRAAEQDSPEPPARALQLDYDSVGVLMILLMLLGALMIWEGIRWVLIELATTWTPGASARKLRRLRKIQEATTEAIEREMQRLQEEVVSERTRSPTTATPQRTSSSPVVQQGEREDRQRSSQASSSTARRRMQEEDYDAQQRRYAQRQRTPSPMRDPLTPMSSPTVPETRDDVCRVAHDLCFLMTVESLKEALRTENLQVTGVKDAQAWRLAYRLTELSTQGIGPTVKQMKYVLWLYRVKDMKGRHTLRYCEVNDKSRISALINQWKSL